jgi:hypothetical protein
MEYKQGVLERRGHGAEAWREIPRKHKESTEVFGKKKEIFGRQALYSYL